MENILQAGVVSAPLQVLIDRLATFTVNETSLILDVDVQVRKLQRTLERIRAMVGHVHSVFSNGISNEAWSLWLQEISKLSYSADDLLDAIFIDMLKYKTNISVRSIILSSLKLSVPREICKVTRELEDLAKEMESLFLTELTINGSDKISNTKSMYCYYSSSIVNEKLIVGRDKQRDEIIEWLLLNSFEETNVSVMPIVGMGGIGKTTIAQVVYGSCSVMKDFDLRIWASVSTDFDVVRITKSIIESATGKICKLCDLDPIQVRLRDFLNGKRFLLVLDDYWSEQYGDWDVLSLPFRAGAHGSKIIVTTRSVVVSRIVGSVPSYDLETLTDEECWEVMKQRAFSNQTTEKHSNLEEIGRMIANKCKGLPLAAKTLGSMLHFESGVVEWKSILNSEIWESQTDKNDTIPALALSYHHLPAHLQKCFAYCSIFSKNHEYQMQELVLLWMAEGFIRPVGKLRLEDIGADYFKDLLWRSFFQVSPIPSHAEVVYRMHDLVHSVAKLVHGNTSLFLEDIALNEEYPLITNYRHLSLNHRQGPLRMLKCFPWYRNLRTFRLHGENIGILRIPYDLFVELKVLRVLDLSSLGLEELPDSIDNSKHLRYLNISENPIPILPESITNLIGLQILNLDHCFQLLALPRDMKNMISLRHLNVNVQQLCCMPSEFGKLVNLQCLDVFIVGKTKGFGIGELKNMKFLRGSICIKKLENVLNGVEAKEAMLSTKPYLNKIELEWDGPRSGNIEEQILAGLCPHENLKELSIINYNGFLFPSWLSSPLCKISCIRLQSCRHYNILSSLGNLQYLKSLHIEDMFDCLDSLQFSGFPVLESLTVKDMPNLTNSIEIHVGSLPRVRTLIIIDCPRLIKLPQFINLHVIESLNISRCPQVMSMPDDGVPVSLQALVISECDILTSRCRSVEGEDWFKIKSVRKIEIDYVPVHQQP